MEAPNQIFFSKTIAMNLNKSLGSKSESNICTFLFHFFRSTRVDFLSYTGIILTRFELRAWENNQIRIKFTAVVDHPYRYFIGMVASHVSRWFIKCTLNIFP